MASTVCPPELQERFLEACLWDPTLDSRWRGEEPPQGSDTSRSAWDLSLARLLRRNGFSFADFVLLADVWEHGTGSDGDARQRRRAWDKASEGEVGAEPELRDDPVPLFTDEEPAPYPIAALPKIMRAAVRSYQGFGRQPVELVACSAVSAAALCCQGLADVDRDGNLIGPCSLSFLIIAVSGERKTTVDKRWRRAIRDWQQHERAQREPDIAIAKRQVQIWRHREEGILQKIKRLAGSADRDDKAEFARLEMELKQLDAEPKVPPEVNLFHEDTTPERLAVSLANGWPSSSLWSDEAGLIVGSHAMSEEVALRFLALLNRLWDGNEFDRERETTTSAHIRGRRFTVSLMLQPHILGNLIAIGAADAGSDGVARGGGALGRFLLAWPRTTIGGRFYKAGDLDSPELKAFDQRLEQLLGVELPVDDDGALQPRQLPLSSEAFEVWRQFHDDVERELGRQGEFAALPDFGSKCAEQAARLACVFQLFVNEHSKEIGARMMRAGAEVALWHLHEARRTLDRIGTSGEVTDAQALLGWLHRREDEPTLMQTLQFGPSRLRDKKRRDRAIQKLVEHGIARLQKRDGKTYLALNPKVREWVL